MASIPRGDDRPLFLRSLATVGRVIGKGFRLNVVAIVVASGIV
jgi:hypothetical protein